ncbi:helix-turn-helix domain-containing protein [Streptomyces beihaiensis]|uniref:Helix-turn-helix domain-containing protein n=1 Tax=Streptomyces beihaiensis TaxID=2984495 RepID=A0ABT3U0U4_9ACTN|nr:helix-turn-helix transcriptional regulator [Streptomyces beihaiensis]MCX3062232.1 helix-turn-helix domain-containing protein [Streptomyces beihaiensis]
MRISVVSGASRHPGLEHAAAPRAGRTHRQRAAAHHTQESLFAATGLSRSHLQRIESGEADPRYSDLLTIAQALGKDVSVLNS